MHICFLRPHQGTQDDTVYPQTVLLGEESGPGHKMAGCHFQLSGSIYGANPRSHCWYEQVACILTIPVLTIEMTRSTDPLRFSSSEPCTAFAFLLEMLSDNYDCKNAYLIYKSNISN